MCVCVDQGGGGRRAREICGRGNGQSQGHPSEGVRVPGRGVRRRGRVRRRCGKRADPLLCSRWVVPPCWLLFACYCSRPKKSTRLRFCVGARCDQAIHPARDEELSEPANGRQRMISWYRSDASRLHYPTHARTQIQTTASRRHFFIGGGPPPFFFAMGGGWVGHFRG